MARPETLDDLESYQREPHEFVKVDLQHITVDVAVGAAVLALIAAARESSAFAVDEDGQFRVTVPLTQQEIDSRLLAAQRQWDSIRDGYESARTDPSAIQEWRRYGIDQWAKSEGRESIVWDDVEATD